MADPLSLAAIDNGCARTREFVSSRPRKLPESLRARRSLTASSSGHSIQSKNTWDARTRGERALTQVYRSYQTCFSRGFRGPESEAQTRGRGTCRGTMGLSGPVGLSRWTCPFRKFEGASCCEFLTHAPLLFPPTPPLFRALFAKKSRGAAREKSSAKAHDDNSDTSRSRATAGPSRVLVHTPPSWLGVKDPGRSPCLFSREYKRNPSPPLPLVLTLTISSSCLTFQT